MKQLKNLLPLMLLALLTWNCQNEDIHPVHEGQASKEIYATADQGEVLDLLLDNSGKAGKNGQSPYVDYDMDGLALEEITETDAKLMVIPASTKHKGQQSRILALRVRDTLRTVVFNMYPNTKGGQNGPFSGEITLATLQGELLGGYKVEEGRLAMYYALEGPANGETLQSKASDDECRQWCGHHWSDPTCICNTQHLEGVTVTAPNNQSITYMPLNGLHMGGESPYGDGGVGGNYWDYGGAGGGGSNPSFDFEDKIDDTALKPCLKNILNDLKTLDKGVGEIVKKFAGNIPGFNWEVKDGNTGNSNASTSPFYNNGVTTTFSSSNLSNATDLSIARTMFHEVVHAYFVTVQNLNLTVEERSQLMGDNWFALVPKLVPNQGHALFASNFVNDIASSLYEYANKHNINVSLQYCKDLAWGGLTHYAPNGNQNYELAPWFIQNVPSSSDRQRILNNIDKEQNGKIGKKGNDAGC